jgi:hypothetical protein
MTAPDPELYCDVDALEVLTRQLGAVKAVLENAKETLQGADGGGGSWVFHQALNEFIEGWKDGRKKIIGEIDELLDKVRGSAQAYRDTEAEICRAARGGG